MPCYTRITVTQTLSPNTNPQVMIDALKFIGYELRAERPQFQAFYNKGFDRNLYVDYRRGTITHAADRSDSLNRDDLTKQVKMSYGRSAVYTMAMRKKWKVRQSKSDPYKLTVTK